MPDEAELRQHRCCFTGHRPEKLDETEEEVQDWLEAQIDRALADGYTTFITGCAMGVDIWAGQIVLRKKAENPNIHLIAAIPWPGFSRRWKDEWQRQYSELIKRADLVVNVCSQYHNSVFQQWNRWRVDHSNRVIAFFSGAAGGTKNTIEYAKSKGVEVIINDPKSREQTAMEREAREDSPPGLLFPENIAVDIGLAAIFGEEKYTELSGDQMAGLEYIIGTLRQRERELIQLRYKEGRTFRECGDCLGFSRQRAQQIAVKAMRKLRQPSRIAFIRDGFAQAELALKIRCAEDMKSILLKVQKKRYPLMTEEDIVKFAFQGMLGVGHLIPSEEEALRRLHAEMIGLQPGGEEPLTEGVSPQWFRLNLRAAKAKGISEADIAHMLCQSAKRKPLSFTRQNVYNFCVKLDGSERMRAAAQRVLDENWLPSHSEQYREAYRPAYRVLYKDFRKLPGKKDEDD